VSSQRDEAFFTTGSLSNPLTNVPEHQVKNRRYLTDLKRDFDRVFTSHQPDRRVHLMKLLLRM
jgi:hypothetical protein